MSDSPAVTKLRDDTIAYLIQQGATPETARVATREVNFRATQEGKAWAELDGKAYQPGQLGALGVAMGFRDAAEDARLASDAAAAGKAAAQKEIAARASSTNAFR